MIYLGICKLQQQWHYLVIRSQSSPRLCGSKLQLLLQEGSKASTCLAWLGQDSKSTTVFQSVFSSQDKILLKKLYFLPRVVWEAAISRKIHLHYSM